MRWKNPWVVINTTDFCRKLRGKDNKPGRKKINYWSEISHYLIGNSKINRKVKQLIDRWMAIENLKVDFLLLFFFSTKRFDWILVWINNVSIRVLEFWFNLLNLFSSRELTRPEPTLLKSYTRMVRIILNQDSHIENQGANCSTTGKRKSIFL